MSDGPMDSFDQLREAEIHLWIDLRDPKDLEELHSVLGWGCGKNFLICQQEQGHSLIDSIAISNLAWLMQRLLEVLT